MKFSHTLKQNPENYDDRTRTIHRILCRLATFYQWNSQLPLLSICIIQNLPFLSKTATKMLWQMEQHLDGNRQSDRGDHQNALPTIAWASRQCTLAQLSITTNLWLCHHDSHTPCHHIPVGLVQPTGRSLGVERHSCFQVRRLAEHPWWISEKRHCF